MNTRSQTNPTSTSATSTHDTSSNPMREASQSIVSLPETLDSELTLLWILASSGFATGMPGGQGVIGSSTTIGHNTLGGHNSEFFLR